MLSFFAAEQPGDQKAGDNEKNVDTEDPKSEHRWPAADLAR
jgi:hypothetical protein